MKIGRLIRWLGGFVLVALIGIGAVGFGMLWPIVGQQDSSFGRVEDEARRAGRDRESFEASAIPHFAAMDKGILALSKADFARDPVVRRLVGLLGMAPEALRTRAIRGQNTWMVWTGGNDRFWDALARRYSFGNFDLLKVISSYPGQAYGRHKGNRWSYLGLVNEPCFRPASKASIEHSYGLWLDEPIEGCGEPDPFQDAQRYPGVQVGARGTTMEPGSFYGRPSGILGLRLFPNPDFDEQAAARWDARRYYEDPSYYEDQDLVRPYRVGMSCAFCHVGPAPERPPPDPENPQWENINSNPGAQYFWVSRIFVWDTQPRDPAHPGRPAKNEYNFIYQLFHTNPPGALDTSLISTDYINNPRTMNAVYSIAARLGPTLRWGREQLSGGQLANKQFDDYPQTRRLSGFWDPATAQVHTARVLKDGSDSVGILGALNRVYLNIGLFSEEWLLHFYPVIGGRKITPIEITDAQKNSVYWQATEDQTPDMAIFFLLSARPDRLEVARRQSGAADYDPAPPGLIEQGKRVFGQNCAVCHSSKIPAAPEYSGVDTGVCAGGGNGPHYRECWDRYWAWAQTPEFKREMVEMVQAPDFLEDNFLSTERRVPVDLLQTNACSPLATNALAGDIWDDFSSDSYKSLPPPRELTVHHPVSGAAMALRPLGNGRGYTRPASLVSLWSTAPLLLNNSVGHQDYGYGAPASRSPAPGPVGARSGYAPAGRDRPQGGGEGYPAQGRDEAGYSGQDYDPYDPGVASRLRVFEDSITKLLYPQRRRRDEATAAPVPGYIYRTTAPSCLRVPRRYVPGCCWDWLAGAAHWLAPWAVNARGDIELGPFPEGMPVNLLANTQLVPDHDQGGGLGHYWRLLKLGWRLGTVLKEAGGACSAEELDDPGVRLRARRAFYDSGLVDQLIGLSKCPDYVVNKGHYFGTDLPDPDKQALIAYLKTL